MSLHNRWRIACFLCNFKGVPLLRGASAKFLISCSFHPFNGFLCRFRIFPLLWGAPSGKTADKTAVSNAFLYNISWKECKPLRSDVSTGIYTHSWHAILMPILFHCWKHHTTRWQVSTILEIFDVHMPSVFRGTICHQFETLYKNIFNMWGYMSRWGPHEVK